MAKTQILDAVFMTTVHFLKSLKKLKASCAYFLQRINEFPILKIRSDWGAFIYYVLGYRGGVVQKIAIFPYFM